MSCFFFLMIRRPPRSTLFPTRRSSDLLLLLLLVQLPLADRMMRQLRDGERERLELLARAADASSDERRRIAGSLHDGIVQEDRKSTRLNSSHANISYAVFCLKKKKKEH